MSGELRGATEPTSDFDKAVEAVKRLEGVTAKKAEAGSKKTSRNCKSEGERR